MSLFQVMLSRNEKRIITCCVKLKMTLLIHDSFIVRLLKLSVIPNICQKPRIIKMTMSFVRVGQTAKTLLSARNDSRLLPTTLVKQIIIHSPHD